MNNKKTSGALAAIALSAIFAQSNEGQRIDVKADKVSENLRDNFDLLLEEKESHDTLFIGLTSLSQSIKVNGQDLKVDSMALLASVSASNKDSTTAGVPSGAVGQPRGGIGVGAIAANCYGNCYRNCHRACHGSRGWR